MKVAAYTKTGSKKNEQASLEKAVFAVEANHELVALAYRAYLANGRTNNARTLTRGLVRGGGKKPWRQKGTGRARVGSIRVPNWRGGGVVFGPSGQENYEIKLTLKAKRAAIRQALSLQAADKKVAIIDHFDTDGKVKSTLKLLQKLEASGNTLIVLPEFDALADRATRNIPGVMVVSAKHLNVFNVMNADLILITSPAADIINEWLGEAKPAKDESKKAAPKSKVAKGAKKPAAKRAKTKKEAAK